MEESKEASLEGFVASKSKGGSFFGPYRQRVQHTADDRSREVETNDEQIESHSSLRGAPILYHKSTLKGEGLSASYNQAKNSSTTDRGQSHSLLKEQS
ncbi:hypothetical protein M9H77_36419 [Catharanthus roseus]|uniref:Uncharacterized protein n=1 Tax=Catharanthus roseus TaxID=4058 RepID=A0ACB9ZTK0_CATRO|nr:hypothetical protein M9H77_36419 [Catharanthus roseus]